VREYSHGSSLQVHADMVMSNVISAIVHISEHGILEDWPLTLVAHNGTAVKLTMKPGDVVLYEASACAHGRPHPLKAEPSGRYGNFFLYWRPRSNWAFAGTNYARCTEARCPIPKSFLIHGADQKGPHERKIYHPRLEGGDYTSTFEFTTGSVEGKLGFKFSADRDGKLPVVTYVHPGEWAETVGLLTGDVLFDLNGQRTNTMNGDELRLALKIRPLTIRIGRPHKRQV